MEEFRIKFKESIGIDNQAYRLFEAVFHSSSNIMMILDKDSTIVHINKSGVKAIRKPLDQILGSRVGEVFNCVEVETGCNKSDNCKNCSVRNAFNFTLSTGDEKRDLYSELNIWDLDTTIKSLPVLITTTDLTLNNDKYVLLILNDITELKEIEKQLLKSKSKLRDVRNKYKVAFETSPDAINITKYTGEYIDVNEGFELMTGYSKDDVLGKTSFDIKIWDNISQREQMLEAFKKDGSVTDMPAVFKCKDGSKKNVLLSAKYVEIKRIPHILSIIREV